MKKILAITVLTLAAAGIVTGCSGKDIGRDAALEAAFNDAGVSESDTTRLKVSEAGLRAVLISHRSGRNTNPPIRTTDAQKNTRKPTVF